MGKGILRILIVALCAAFVFVPICSGQQSADKPAMPAPAKALTPQQQAYQKEWQQYSAKRQSLQVQAKQILYTEMGREQHGDCTTSNTTAEFNDCFDQRLQETEANLKNFEDIIRQLQSGLPQMPGSAEEPTAGPAGPAFTPQQQAAEFDRLEQAWQNYREVACTAAFHQFDGGSGAPSFQMQCQLKLTRDHMRELDLVYGIDLHL